MIGDFYFAIILSAGKGLNPSARIDQFPSLGNPGFFEDEPSQPPAIMAIAVSNPPFDGK
ncbi:hypothetical protein D3C87_1930390 [compost metagenome]